jgi:hypothetical protein
VFVADVAAMALLLLPRLSPLLVLVLVVVPPLEVPAELLVAMVLMGDV